MIAAMLAGAAALTVAHQDVTLHAPDGRDVPVRVFAPARGCKGCTLVIFSHGAYSTYDRYDVLLENWAAHGLVVAAPLHVDSEEHPHRKDFGANDSRPKRFEDYATVDAAFRPGVPNDLKGISFSGKVVAAGHSYGALIAEVIGGATLDGDGEASLKRSWRAPMAVIAISPPGVMPGFVTEAGYAALSRPTLVVSGTADVLPGFIDKWDMHLASYHAAKPGIGYSLVFDGMNHYFNGAYCRILPEGVKSAPQVARLNQEILGFIDAAGKDTLPDAAKWATHSGGGVVAAAK